MRNCPACKVLLAVSRPQVDILLAGRKTPGASPSYLAGVDADVLAIAVPSRFSLRMKTGYQGQL